MSQSSQYKPLTNEDKFEAIAEFVRHFIKTKHAGSVTIRLDLLNGGITTIRTSVDGKLFPVEAN